MSFVCGGVPLLRLGAPDYQLVQAGLVVAFGLM